MRKETLKVIADTFSSIGINYEFGEWTSEPQYPYFVGEYQEIASSGENGEQETAFILNGFARYCEHGKTALLALEDAKENIKTCLGIIGGRMVTTESGAVVAIFYENSLLIPIENAELRKIQVNLLVKEWSVN